MKHSLARRRGSIVLAATILVLAGIAWGAAIRPHTGARRADPIAASPTTQPAAAAAVAQQLAHVPSTHISSTTTVTQSVPQSVPMAGDAGMRIFRDPETGEIGPPTEENAAIIAQDSDVPFDNTKLPTVNLPGGGVELLIDGKIEDAVVLKIDAQGHRVMTCVTDEKAAHKHAPAKTPAATREDR